MPAFASEFSHEQRDAVASAYVDRGVRPMARVLELAAAGELVEGMAPVEVNERTARDWARNLKRRRAGKVASERIKDLKPEDAMEALKLRLIASADEGMTAQERLKPDKRDWEAHRQIARALREAAAIPSKGERGNRPGDRSPDTGAMDNGGETRGGLAGAILAAARGGVPRQERDTPSDKTQGQDAHGAQHSTPSTPSHNTEQSGGGRGGAASDRATSSSQAAGV